MAEFLSILIILESQESLCACSATIKFILGQTLWYLYTHAANVKHLLSKVFFCSKAAPS